MTEDEAKRLSDRPHDRQPIGNERRSYFVRFGVSKQNYDATPLDRWYMRHLAAYWCQWNCMRPAGGGEGMRWPEAKRWL